MMIEQTYSLDLVPSGKPLVVYCSQFDSKSRRLRFNLYKDNVAFSMPSGASATIVGTKPDLTGFNYTMTVSGSSVYIDIEDQMTAVPGPVLCEVKITSANNERLGTSNFTLYVEKAAFDSDTVISETDLPIFEELVAEANSAAAEAQAAAESVSGVTGQVATNTNNISGLTTRVGTAERDIDTLEGLLNGWKLYPSNQWAVTTDLTTIVTEMQNRSIFIAPVATPETDFGGVPTGGVLMVIKYDLGKLFAVNTRTISAGSVPITYMANYSRSAGTMTVWRQIVFKTDIVGSNLEGFMLAINSAGGPYLRWIGPDSHYYQIVINTTTGTYSFQEYIDGAWQTLIYPISQPSLKGTKCLLIGNSFARGTKGDTTTWESISGSAHAGRGWCYYFYQRTGCVPKVISQSGGDFIAVGNKDTSDYEGMNYLQALQQVTESYTAAERNAFKYVIVGGGYNDICKSTVSVSQITSAIASFVTYVKTNYPNARIWIIPLLQSSGHRDPNFYSRVNAYVNAAAANGVCTSARSESWFLGTGTTYSSTDNVHLNDAGYRLAGAYIASLVQGWDGTLPQKETAARTLYNSGGIIMTRAGTEISCNFSGCGYLPDLSTVNNLVGDPWLPKNPNTQFFPLWDYANRRIVWITISQQGFEAVRLIDHTVLANDQENPTFNLYGNIRWNVDFQG